MTPSGAERSREISHAEIARIVDEQLPHWHAVCDHRGADTIFLNQRPFGLSDKEFFLLAIAIKYAGIAKKIVAITPD
jgi:hypothetical protein